MKRLLLAAALASSLGGCITTQEAANQINEALGQAQQVAVASCGFLPTFQTIQNIVVAAAYPAGTPIAQIANQVGNAICAAVTAKSARLGSTGPTVRGVPVRGSWVRKR